MSKMRVGAQEGNKVKRGVLFKRLRNTWLMKPNSISWFPKII